MFFFYHQRQYTNLLLNIVFVQNLFNTPAAFCMQFKPLTTGLPESGVTYTSRTSMSLSADHLIELS